MYIGYINIGKPFLIYDFMKAVMALKRSYEPRTKLNYM